LPLRRVDDIRSAPVIDWRNCPNSLIPAQKHCWISPSCTIGGPSRGGTRPMPNDVLERRVGARGCRHGSQPFNSETIAPSLRGVQQRPNGCGRHREMSLGAT
jgi:hypothetical protein